MNLSSLALVIAFSFLSIRVAGGAEPSDCATQLKDGSPSSLKGSEITAACQVLTQSLPRCKSVNGSTIFHSEFEPSQKEAHPAAQKILVFALTHGDEPESTQVAVRWINRLNELARQGKIRNHWRIIPVLNPDGAKARTRTNARGVDINRNFPTHDWSALALQYWKKNAQSNPRRYPGASPSSEPETLCTLDQIENFGPDLIVSIHAPYGLVDFDGPLEAFRQFFPKVPRHPSRQLGSFPGSLGRYLWQDRSFPIVTLELNPGRDPLKMSEIEKLQDDLGTFSRKMSQLRKK